MKARVENNGKIALVVVLAVGSYFGISHYRNKAVVNVPVSDSGMIMQDSGSSFSVDTQKSAVVDTVKYVDVVKHVDAKPKQKTVAPKQAAKPDVKVEPKHKTEDRSSLDIQY